MTILEVIATVSTIVCVILSAKENILAWPIGIISALSLIIVYIGGGMYGNIILQSVFLVQCTIGWYNWGKKDSVKMTKLSNKKVILHIIGALWLAWIVGTINSMLNSDLKAIDCYLDSTSTMLALLGNWYLTKKIIQSWPLFMSYNIIIAILFLTQGLYLLSALNIVLFFISFNAFYTWRSHLREV